MTSRDELRWLTDEPIVVAVAYRPHPHNCNVTQDNKSQDTCDSAAYTSQTSRPVMMIIIT